jgi:hypothetical protein
MLQASRLHLHSTYGDLSGVRSFCGLDSPDVSLVSARRHVGRRWYATLSACIFCSAGFARGRGSSGLPCRRLSAAVLPGPRERAATACSDYDAKATGMTLRQARIYPAPCRAPARVGSLAPDTPAGISKLLILLILSRLCCGLQML